LWLANGVTNAVALAEFDRNTKVLTVWMDSAPAKVAGLDVREWLITANGATLLGVVTEATHSWNIEAARERFSVAVTARQLGPLLAAREYLWFAASCASDVKSPELPWRRLENNIIRNPKLGIGIGRTKSSAVWPPGDPDSNATRVKLMARADERARELKMKAELELVRAQQERNLEVEKSRSAPPPPPVNAERAAAATGAPLRTDSPKPVADKKKSRPITSTLIGPPRPTLVERYPTVSAPPTATVGKTFRVKVQLTQDPATPDVKIMDDPLAAARKTAAGALALPLSAERDWEITVTITAPLFHIEGPSSGKFVLKQNDDSQFVEFRLKAEQAAAPESEALIGVRFFAGNQYLARVVRKIAIVPDEASTAERGARIMIQRQDAPPGTLGITSIVAPSQNEEASPPPARQKVAAPRAMAVAAPLPNSPVALDSSERAPDIRVLIDGFSGKNYGITVVPLGRVISTGAFVENPDIRTWLQEGMDVLVQAGQKIRRARGTPEEANAIEQGRLVARGFGRMLYTRYCPAEFKRELEALLEERKGKPYPLGTIQIQTSDPAFPWELMVPTGNSDQWDFLGTMFQVSRWHHKLDSVNALSEKPAAEIIPGVILYISPDYGDKSLAARDIEREEISKLRGYLPVPASLASVEKMLSETREGIVHFSGHAAAKAASGVYSYTLFLDGDAELNVQTLYGIKGLSARHTLFFMNACHSAEASKYANYVDGWAPALLDAGASGYIGGLWDVFDDAAADVARVFYKALSSGAPVAESLRQARLRFNTTGDPTYLAYAYYGNVFLTPAKR
jgi:hypothetical protein